MGFHDRLRHRCRVHETSSLLAHILRQAFASQSHRSREPVVPQTSEKQIIEKGFLCRIDALQTRIAMRHYVPVLLAVVCLLGTFLSLTQAAVGTVGAPKDVNTFANSMEIDELATFTVDRYKSRQNSIAEISFSKVLSVKEQVVQGTMYYLTIEVMEGGKPKLYDAKVWVKPWQGYKELESFEPSVSSHHDPAVELSVKSGGCHEKEQITA